MKVGLVGFTGSGKSTVFRWLTGEMPDPGQVQKGQIATTDVPDPRLDYFAAQFKPRKTTYAKIVFVDTPGLLTEERDDNPKRLAVLREATGLVVVLDGFSGADPAKALRQFREEILFADMEVCTNRLDRLKVALTKKNRPPKERELEQAEHDLLERLITAFENGRTAASLGLKEEEEKLVRSFQLLTLKPQQVLLNCGDTFKDPVPPALFELAPDTLKAAPKLELELQELPPDERDLFMQALGFTQSTRDQTIRTIFTAMGRIVFFTVGEDECRSWAISRGDDVVEAAGAIHTDLAKRFARARVIGYDDYVKAGSEKEARAQGLERLEGKTYIVQDGDVIHIL